LIKCDIAHFSSFYCVVCFSQLCRNLTRKECLCAESALTDVVRSILSSEKDDFDVDIPSLNETLIQDDVFTTEDTVDEDRTTGSRKLKQRPVETPKSKSLASSTKSRKTAAKTPVFPVYNNFTVKQQPHKGTNMPEPLSKILPLVHSNDTEREKIDEIIEKN